MYERFYNLRERPFSLSPDPDYLYPSRVHTEALSYLRYGIQAHAAFVVVTGEIGTGKTTLLQTTMRGIDKRTSVARLVNTTLDARELIEAIMLDFGLDPPAGWSKPYLLRDLARFLVEQRRAGRLALLVVDEAQNLSLAALEEVRMLSNLETEKSKLIQIVLVGQPNLHELLGRPELEQLRQRITVRYHLRALDPGETAAYINHRLRKAAIGAPLTFSSEVTDLIWGSSQGVPRKINVIGDAALLFGYGEDKRVIDAKLTREVIAELEATGVIIAPASAKPAISLAAAAPAASVDTAAREARIAPGEPQPAQQRRVLTEQHRAITTEQHRAMTRCESRAPALRATRTSVAPKTPWPRATAAPAVKGVRQVRDAISPAWWTRLRRGFLTFFEGEPN